MRCNRTPNAAEVRSARQALADVLGAPVPARALAALVQRGATPLASAFERYAADALSTAAGEWAESLFARDSLKLTAPGGAKLARLACPDAPNQNNQNATSKLIVPLRADERLALGRVEDALNRLICIVDAEEDGIGGTGTVADAGTGISMFGTGYLPHKSGYRGAHVVLPQVGNADQMTEAYLNEVDWRVLDHIASNGHAVYQSSVLPNPFRSLLGVTAKKGGDWDVRTRLAVILEGLELPLRFSYRYDCDASTNTSSIHFTIPDARSFPRVLPDSPGVDVDDDARTCEELAATARMVYVLRVASLLGAAVYATGRSMQRACLTAWEGDWDRPVLSCAFERDGFVFSVLKAIDDGELARPSLRFDFEGVAAVVSPCELYVADLLDPASRAAIVEDGLADHRAEVWRDERPLPDTLRELFGASRVCDIDTAHYFGGRARATDDARMDADGSLMAATVALEQVAENLEAVLSQDDQSDLRPLYCDNALSRAVVSLIGDQLSVAQQAEQFLAGEEGGGKPEPLRFRRAPDALFHAHMGLSDLYERLGEYRSAERHADRCVELAPTTSGAHFRKADILVQQGRVSEAVNVLSDALATAVRERDCALLYYHLALFLWNMGCRQEACAIYVYAAKLEGEYAARSRKVVVGLRAQDDVRAMVPADADAAERELRRMRIPVAPSAEARRLVVQAALGLADANAPLAAAPYASAVARYERHSPALTAACASLRDGVALLEKRVKA